MNNLYTSLTGPTPQHWTQMSPDIRDIITKAALGNVPTISDVMKLIPYEDQYPKLQLLVQRAANPKVGISKPAKDQLRGMGLID